ncbi:bifunctional DNA-binding transcriptional regulator/O6-methylguanine-DNA methyltransferase Ada [Lichenifustis flavocetrariae]|uniref:methylated-DNA--[protein]-cysteine S-methyltransferase n=1 Tax=Lichenifustis flavocetrariae TaxID=2949735 RepID=A0AA41YSL0_9HYPH|nr:bifunctional DNA-binding transcriptional regulator/O6-methylguanine-DNA methyltransferase Ada [Lichenifustis flavocetrariae]MCW6507404.1 bifunctional DNA-binding transcriptional regulator/O6-methylguanine-DNA methyltransferase Ada [Lichenifustis flavocetrariae]
MSAMAMGDTTKTVQTQQDARWRAVMERDATLDGSFVYAVATTGVYCRPSCPSRRAKAENVSFYGSAAAAARAGFRPCLRCRPDQHGQADAHAAVVADACRTIAAAETLPSLAVLARQAGLSPFHFHRVFKAATGVTPRAYAVAHRTGRLQAALAAPDANVTQAIYEAGFNASSRAYAAADEALGMTPSAYRTGGRETVIRFAVGACSLGAILVAATPRGLCAILLGDDPDALVRDLQDRFPKAELIGGDPDFERHVATVIGLVEAPGGRLDLPLDIAGTAFQRRVWEALRAIPPGRTASYAEIAATIGLPRAVRAVAQACAANALAVAIPCHRVVRSDGGLSGYRWGVDRKRALLDREAER